MKENNKKTNEDRRDFIKKTVMGSAALGLGGMSFLNAREAKSILGANDRIRFAVIGTHSRGKALAKAVASSPNTSIDIICDVDSRVVAETIEMVKQDTGKAPKGEKDIRKVLENKDIDAIAIATPDHWHAPMSILAVKAGKHVYVEKPCSHNPREGEILVEAQKKYGKIVQMGNQQRSAKTSIEAVKLIREGIIGKPYFGKCWYSNKRGPIGYGKEAPVPEWLDYELWQGPAPRTPYRDNVIHYNWHWFWRWGTGEALNNGTHEIDVCRWALGVEFPDRVSSAGGRYHYQDDWEFYDTQVINYEYDQDKLITWEGKSCNPQQYYNRGRGSLIHGTNGTVLVDRNGYIIWNLDGEVIKEAEEKAWSATTDTTGAGFLDVVHMTNFLDAIRKGEKQNSPINEGHVSITMCQLGNIAQKTGRILHLNNSTGHIQNDKEAMKLWSRDYEPGWEPGI